MVKTSRGTTQGEPLSMKIFAMVMTTLLKEVDAGKPVMMIDPRFADNITLMAPPAECFAHAIKIENALKPAGMHMQQRKFEVLLRNSVNGADTVLTMTTATQRGYKVCVGFSACGSPVGPPGYCIEAVKKTVDKACVSLDRIRDLANFQGQDSALSKQNANVLMRYCVAPAALVHILRCTPPDFTKASMATFDRKVEETVLAILGAQNSVGNNDERSKFNERLHLDAVSGGGGFTSCVDLAESAYIGSIALTMSQAVGMLPANTQLEAAFPHAKKLIDNGVLHAAEGLKDMTLRDFAKDPCLKVQKTLTMARREARFKKVLDGGSPQSNANLYSQASAEASAFLTVVPGSNKALQLNNAEFTTAASKWLGISTTTALFSGRPPDCNAINCLACRPLPAPNAAPPQAGVVHQPVYILKNETAGCSHALSCRGGGRGGVGGKTKGARHHSVNSAIELTLRLNAKRPSGVTMSIAHEPSLFDVAEPKAANPKKQRGDISVSDLHGNITVIDTTVALANASSLPAAATTAGTAATKRVKDKIAKYSNAWKLNDGVKLVVAAIESGGRWDMGFIGYIKGYIKAAHPDDTKSFVYQLKAATQRISIALQRSTARAILEMNRRAMTYPGTTI